MMPPDDLQHTLRTVAEQAARAGGKEARRQFQSGFTVRLKDDRSEVSEADEAAQAAVIATLRAARPDDGLIAEESLDHDPQVPVMAPPTDNVPCWIVDPIDGTRNYVRGIPIYCCSVGVMLGGHPVAGAIYDPHRDVLYSASHAEGLFINDQHAQHHPPLPTGLNPRLVVGIPSSPNEACLPIAQKWLGKHVCRNFGTTALQLALVAAEQLDGALADNPRLWDVAAGCVLVTAAGGRVSDFHGQPVFPVDVSRYAGGEIPCIVGTPDAFEKLLDC